MLIEGVFVNQMSRMRECQVDEMWGLWQIALSWARCFYLHK